MARSEDRSRAPVRRRAGLEEVEVGPRLLGQAALKGLEVPVQHLARRRARVQRAPEARVPRLQGGLEAALQAWHAGLGGALDASAAACEVLHRDLEALKGRLPKEPRPDLDLLEAGPAPHGRPGSVLTAGHSLGVRLDPKPLPATELVWCGSRHPRGTG